VNVLKLGEVEYPMGELTGAHLEDHYDAVAIFSQMSGMPTREQFAAAITLAWWARGAAGSTMTRDEMRALVRLPNTPALVSAVGRSLGFVEASGAKGEAKSPESSQS
jgi:hypothetical protein